jgi:hypothetical protein
MSVCRDITERKQAEHVLRDLSRRVIEAHEREFDAGLQLDTDANGFLVPDPPERPFLLTWHKSSKGIGLSTDFGVAFVIPGPLVSLSRSGIRLDAELRYRRRLLRHPDIPRAKPPCGVSHFRSIRQEVE